jgi:hypothetical protein
MAHQFLVIFVSVYLGTSFQTTPLPCELACASPPNKVWISSKVNSYSADVRNRVIYHELGHIFDYQYMTELSRLTFELYVLNDLKLWHGGIDPPSEKFAEAFTACLVGTRKMYYSYGYNPSQEEYDTACNLIKNVYYST